MSESEGPVLVEVSGGVARVTLNRPARLNAFDQLMIEGLAATMTRLAADDAVRVVVLTGAGRAFCAGGDLEAIRGASDGSLDKNLRELAGTFHEAIATMTSMRKPVVGAINGVAAGGGFSLALACDVRLMVEGGMFKQAYTWNGLCVDGGGTWTLPRLVGLAKALELAILDPAVPAEEARRLGLVAEVVAPDAFADRVGELAVRLAAGPVGALGLAKHLLRTSYETDLPTRLDQEAEGIAAQAAGPEGQEGIAAFLGKRKPDFPGAS